MNTLISNMQTEGDKLPPEEREPESRPAHFAIFLPSFRGGGAERAMILLAEEFCRRGHQVDMIMVSTEGPLAKTVPRNVRVIALNRRRTAAALPDLVKYLRSEEPTALYTTMAHSNVVALIAGKVARRGTRVVVREANVPLSSGKTRSRGLLPSLIPALISLTYNWAHSVVSVSNDVATELLKISPRLNGKVRVLPTPVISESILQSAERAIEHPWFSADAPPVILGAGRLHPQKDFLTLLRAFALLKHDARLIVLGEGPERKKLLAEAQRLGLERRVDFPGYVDNPFAYMKRASLFVLSSRYEGMPNVLIQAMALGTPVISTDCPGGSRDVLLNGRLGELVPLADPEALAEAIEKTLNRPHSAEPATYVNRYYRVEPAAAQYLGLLDFDTT